MRSALAFTFLIISLPMLTTGSSMAPIREQTPSQQAARLHDAVIESIEVADVSADVRKTVLSRIGVRVGDTLTGSAKQKIGAEIGRVMNGMTFTYRPGFKPGTVKLRIDPSC
jgi:hypothetical protein